MTCQDELLSFERLTGKCPSVWLGHGLVEVFDEFEQPLMQCIDGREVAAFDNSPNNHTKPDFHLIQPRAVFRNVDEPNLLFHGCEKRFASFLGLQNSGLPFHPQHFHRQFKAFHCDHPQHETFRPVRVELIDNDSPVGIRMPCHRSLAVFQKIQLRASGADRRRNGLSRDNMEAGDQTQRAMPDVFVFDPFFLTGPHVFFGAMRSNA